MLSMVDSQTLVLGADTNGADDVASDEEEEEDIVEFGVLSDVEDGQEDKTGTSDGGEDHGEAGEDLFEDAEVCS